MKGFQVTGVLVFSLSCLLSLLYSTEIPADDTRDAVTHASKSSGPFPTCEGLATSRHQPILLPGQDDAVFTIYGAPSEVEKLRQLVAVMREQQLGNGIDPGPGLHPSSRPAIEYLATVGWPVVVYPGADMQILGGRDPLRPEQESLMQILDQAGVFNAVQLGEWGYYFHNLAHTEDWWRAHFGADFEAYKHLMKPAGLAGYEKRPTTKRECYEIVREYYTGKNRELLHRVISVTGHSHYEAYVGEWGTRCIGLELGENIAFTQSKLAFARGASRQWGIPWSVQVSPWMHGAVTTSGPLRIEGGGARGLDAGHSLSFYERMWLHAWFAGAAMITPENSIAIFFEEPEAPWTLTSHGRKAVEVFTLMQGHERGVPYTPVAIVLDHLNGYNGYMGKPWGILEPTDGDREVSDLFDWQIFPGSDHIRVQLDPENPEAGYLRPTPFGEIFDVHLSTVAPALLASYPAIILAGDIQFGDTLIKTLENALKAGSRILIAERHKAALGDAFEALTRLGELEVLEPWVNPATDRATAVSDAVLAQLCHELLPIRVSGDAIQYQINRNARGWVVELINNSGVSKKKDEPAVIDPEAIAEVNLEARVPVSAIREWRSQRTHTPAPAITVTVGPGASEFVEFVLAE